MATATTNEDLYSKFLQAKEHLAEYSENITGGLTSLNSKHIMTFNVVSAWITYLSRYIAQSTYVAAKNPTPASMDISVDVEALTQEDVRQAKNSDLRYLYLYVKDKQIFGPFSKSRLTNKSNKKKLFNFYESCSASY